MSVGAPFVVGFAVLGGGLVKGVGDERVGVGGGCTRKSKSWNRTGLSRCPSLVMLIIRDPGPAARILLRMRFVKRKCPMWLVPNWLSSPSTVVVYGDAITAALLTSTSIDSAYALTCFAASRI